MLTTQPFTYSDDDYRTAIAINAAICNEPPDPIAEWKHDDAVRNKDYPYTIELVLRGQDVIAITSGMLDSQPEAVRFFETHGFKRVTEEKISKLDLTRFDAAQHADVLKRVQNAGITSTTLRALQQTDPDWERKLFDLDVMVNRDIPSTGESVTRRLRSGARRA